MHVCNNQEGFTRTASASKIDQLLAGKAVYQIEFFGTVNININSPQRLGQIRLTNVADISGFMTNLVSLSRLVHQGV